MFKIADIFTSVQGEGLNSGRLAFFVRFAGCNAKCDFCDTDHTGKMVLTTEDIVARCIASRAELTILTGGEPLLQITEELVLGLLEYGEVAVETNGSVPIPDSIRNNLSWITVSPKDPACGGKPCIVDYADELKVIWDGRVDPLKLAGNGHWSFKVLQPEWSKWKEHLPNMLAFQKVNPDWRVGIQLHKILNIP